MKLSATQKKLVASLAGGPKSAKEMQAATGITKDMAYSAVYDLHDQGVVSIVDYKKAGNGKWAAVYDLGEHDEPPDPRVIVTRRKRDTEQAGEIPIKTPHVAATRWGIMVSQIGNV